MVVYNEVEHAIREIYDQYRVEVGWQKSIAKSIDKWGQNHAVDATLQTVWNSPADEENYLSDNTIDSIVCTDDDFDGVVAVEGHPIDSNNLSFVRQLITMNGQTAVSLTTPLARCTRVRAQDDTPLALADYVSAYDSSQTTIAAGVPQTDAGVYATMRGGPYRTTEKCATSIDQDSFFLIQEITASIEANKSVTVKFWPQRRTIGQDFFTFIAPFSLSDSQPAGPSKKPGRPLIVPPNSDIRMLCQRTAGSVTVGVTARISGILLRKLDA